MMMSSMGARENGVRLAVSCWKDSVGLRVNGLFVEGDFGGRSSGRCGDADVIGDDKGLCRS